jgi:class 3 adenylate cyclase
MAKKKKESAIAAPAPQAPQVTEAPKKKRRRGLSLGFKFSGFTVLLILVIMGAIGYTLYKQQRATLTREAIQRGRTVVEGLVDSAREAMLVKEELRMALAAKKAAQPADAPIEERRFDLDNPGHWQLGIIEAAQNLWQELLKVLQAFGIAAGSSGPGNALKKPIENEGIFEAYVVDLQPGSLTNGQIIGHSGGSNELGPYKRPSYFIQASEEVPYPVYVKNFQNQRVNLFDISEKIVVSDKVIGEVHIGLSQDLIQKAIFQSTMKLSVIAAVAVLFGLVVTFLMVQIMLAPIGRLLKGVLAIAGGDFDTRVNYKSQDELGELTGAFNTMAKSLGENEVLKGAFTRYVSDAALKQLLADPSKTGLHSRRALATVYTSDVRGFTAMSESLEPEHVVQVINTYLSLQTEVILKHEGVVDKFIGDATVGVFGKEQERDDDALRAVKAALEVQETIARLNVEREKSGEIAKLVGIGINTGIVVAGNMGSTKKMEYTTAGENVILADKLCAECPGGGVWISESTYELVRDHVVAEEKEPLKLKGRNEPFPVFEVKKLKK